MTPEHIGDITITTTSAGCTVTHKGQPLPGVYADAEAAVMATRLPLGVLTELRGLITAEDLEDADLGVDAEAAVGVETIEDAVSGMAEAEREEAQ